MPFSQSQVIEEIRKLIALLEQNKIRIQQAILFGSYARGNAGEWSDIDVALVSENFSGIRFLDWKKVAPFLKYFINFLEVHPFRTDEFMEEFLFPEEIMKHGVRIK